MMKVRFEAEFGGEGLDPFGPDSGRSDHRQEIPVEQLGGPAVDEEQLPEVAPNLSSFGGPTFDQLQHRKTNALMPDLGGLRVVRAGDPTADVGLVGTVAAEPDEVRGKDRPGDDPIGEVVPTGYVGIGEKKDVVGRDVVAPAIDQGSHREPTASGVDRKPIGIGDERAVGAGDEAREVVRLAEDRAAGSSGHDPAHVLADLIQALLHQGKDDRIATPARRPRRGR